MTASDRAAVSGLLGIATPRGSTLDQVVWDVLTRLSDPDGATAPRPLMPTSRGILELHFAGGAVSRSLAPRSIDDVHWPVMLAVLQRDYRVLRGRALAGDTEYAQQLHRRWLGSQCDKYRIPYEDGGATIIPGDLPREDPIRPETTRSDDFNRADQAGLGTSSEGWSWTLQEGGTSDWEIVSNAAAYVGSDYEPAAAIAGGALSGDDHYAEATITPASSSEQNLHVRARADAGDVSGYGASYYSLGDVLELWKFTPGPSMIGDFSSGALSSVLMRCQCDGSTIKLIADSVERVSVTDTSITGNTQCGLYSWVAGQGTWENFVCEDLGGAPAGNPHFYFRNLMAVLG